MLALSWLGSSRESWYTHAWQCGSAMANDSQPTSNPAPLAQLPGDEQRTTHAQAAPSLRPLGLLPAAIGLLYLVALLRTAWLGDDAFITLRAVDNFVHGYGLLSNPPERVLGFTNPLWALLLSLPRAFGVSAYVCAIGMSLLLSMATLVWLVRRAAPDALCGAVAALFLTASAAYVEFSSGGLENPLSHLLLAVFFTQFLAGRLQAARAFTWALAALLVVNRQDHALLIAPALLAMLLEHASQASRAPVSHAKRRWYVFRPLGRAIALGGLPLFAWTGFALVYYGFPFPNTAYAKLNTFLTVHTLELQGFTYFMDSLQRDPITLLVIALALFACARERSRAALATAAGILLYLAYIVRIGGDFMSGRFLTAPFLVGVVWLAARGLPRTAPREVAGIALAAALLALWFPATFRSNERWDCVIPMNGIANERPCYAEYTGLAQNVSAQLPRKYTLHGRFKRGIELRRKPGQVLTSTNVGIMGFAAGPRVHIIDAMALTDPLLARIPYAADPGFRIGHFQRDAPAGYEQTLRSGVNVIKDPCIHAYYDVLSPVIRGPLFTAARWRAIVALNFGRYDYLMRQPCPLSQQAAE